MNNLELITWIKKDGAIKKVLRVFKKSDTLSTCGIVIEENDNNIKIASSKNNAGYNDITEIEKSLIVSRIVLSS